MKARSIKSGHHTGSNDEPMLSCDETTEAHIYNPPKELDQNSSQRQTKSVHDVKSGRHTASNLNQRQHQIKIAHNNE